MFQFSNIMNPPYLRLPGFRIVVFALAVASISLMHTGQTHAANLETSLNTLSEEIFQYLKEKNLSKVSVKTFDGPRTGAGRGISTGLIERLKKRPDLSVVDELESEITVRGNFSISNDSALPFLLLDVELVDTASGAESKEFRQRINEAFEADLKATVEEIDRVDSVDGVKNTPESAKPSEGIPISDKKDFAQIAGPTVDVIKPIEESVPAEKPVDEITDQDREVALDNRNKAIQASIKNPSFALITDTIMAPSQDSDFKMQINVSDVFNGPPEAFPILDRDGLAFIPFREGQFYTITLINQADFDIGVELSIDGINTLAFSEFPAFRESGKWVIPAGRSGTVLGFHINNRFVDAFQVAGIAKGAVEEQFSDQSKIGTITAAIHACWQEGEEPPRAAKIAGIPADLKTVRGPRIQAQSQTVQRVFCETALAFMSVRYVNPDPPSDLPF